MKKILLIVSIVCSLGFMASLALAAVSNTQPLTPVGAGQQGAQVSKVPQAQIDRVKKREEMNKRRAELLKVRQQLIQADSPGNVNGQQSY